MIWDSRPGLGTVSNGDLATLPGTIRAVDGAGDSRVVIAGSAPRGEGAVEALDFHQPLSHGVENSL